MRSRGCGPRAGISDLFRRGCDQSTLALPTMRTHSRKTAGWLALPAVIFLDASPPARETKEKVNDRTTSN